VSGLEEFARLIDGDHGLVVVSTLRADGTILSSAEGPVELAGPDDPMPGVDAERLRLLLREIFTAAGGTHDDWPTYDRTMADERRVAVLVTPARTQPAS